MWQINTFGNGDVLSDVFRSIVFMMGGGYESLLRLGMICLIFGSVSAYLGRGRVVSQPVPAGEGLSWGVADFGCHDEYSDAHSGA